MHVMQNKRKKNTVLRGAAAIAILVFMVFILYKVTWEGRAGETGGAVSIGSGDILISELMASNRHTLMDEDGDYPDWLEIHNRGDRPVDLMGYGLSNDEEDLFKWQLPQTTLQPGQNLLIFASGKDRNGTDGYFHTNFKINRTQEELFLTNDRGRIVDRVTIDGLLPDISYGRSPDNLDTWLYFLKPTPGEENHTPGNDVMIPLERAADALVSINEVLAANSIGISDEEGDRADWIELLNSSMGPVNLDGYYLSNDREHPYKWKFPEVTLGSGEYLLIFASGKDKWDPDSGFLHTNFRLNREKNHLILRNERGELLEDIDLPSMHSDISYGRDIDDRDVWVLYSQPTPGEKNHTPGLLVSQGTPADIRINELMALNRDTLTDADGDHSDWVEVYHAGEDPIYLLGYGLSDDPADPFMWTFPDIVIAPGEYLVVFASGKDSQGAEGELHTNFRLSTWGDRIFLTDPVGQSIDGAELPRLPVDISWGRLSEDDDGWYFFEKPSPGSENTGEAYGGITPSPKFVQKGGFYQEAFSLGLESSMDGAMIRYTMDGSLPNEASALYTQPIPIQKTTVVRARQFQQGYLPGPAKTYTYFIDQVQHLPTISLAASPHDLWDQRDGIYSRGYHASSEFPYVGANFWKDIEKPVHFEIYEPGGRLGFQMDGGMKIFGAYSRAMAQKSLALYARNSYQYDVMTYPFLENKELVSFKHLVLRTSGQDAIFTRIRDIMMTSLMMDTNLDFQGHRQSVVYLNGEYWGIYNIREKINRHFIAYNHGIEDLDTIDILEANGRVKAGENDHYHGMLDFVRRNSLSIPENYEYIKTQMDVENYMDYQILQMFTANTDNGNIRYWRERSETGKWRWIAYDLDWGFYNVNHNSVWHIINPEGTGYARRFSTVLMRGLLQSQEFRDAFVRRFAWHLNHSFQPERVIGIIEEKAANIEMEMPRDLDRWGGNMAGWERQLEVLRDFARRRPAIIVQQLQRHFNLTDEELELFAAYR